MKLNNDNIKTLVNFYANGVPFERFRRCRAWVSAPIFNSAFNVNFRLVKSYNTIVGFINLDTEEYIELGKWSRTTSKQVTQIYNFAYYFYTRKFVDLYNN